MAQILDRLTHGIPNPATKVEVLQQLRKNISNASRQTLEVVALAWVTERLVCGEEQLPEQEYSTSESSKCSIDIPII